MWILLFPFAAATTIGLSLAAVRMQSVTAPARLAN
jgi:hypothetical protein